MIRIRTVREFIWQTAEQFGTAPAYAWEENGVIKEKNYIELNEDVTRTARIMNFEFDVHRKIALLGDTTYPWMVSFFSTVVSGNTAVPMDMKLQRKDIIDRIKFADVSVVLVSDKYSDMKDDILKSCDKVTKVLSLEHFTDNVSAEAEGTILELVYPSEVSFMLFTSGTTGSGFKAAMLTQESILAGVKGYVPLCNPGDNVLSVLPIHHCLELFGVQFKALYSGCRICFNDSPVNIIANMSKFKINSLVVVPAVANLFCSLIEREIKTKSIEEIKKMIGGHFNKITIGGAPADARMISLLDKVGVTVYDGYGLTESSGGCLYNWDPKKHPEACGVPFAIDLDAKISDEGELLLKGPAIMKGYYKQPELTANVLKDGWLHTGDIATIKDNGYAVILGRKDNLIKLANGEKIYPEKWEDKINNIPNVAASMVCNFRNHLTAVIYSINTVNCKKIEKAVNKLNESVPDFMKITEIIFRDRQFPVTSSMKIKRSATIAELEQTQCLTVTKPETEMESMVLAEVKRLIPDTSEISTTQNLYELGLDSLSTVELSVVLNCSPNIIYDSKTIKDIAAALSGSVTDNGRAGYIRDENINSCISAWAGDDAPHPAVESGATVLITGVTGYLGPHIIKELQKHEVKIIALTRSIKKFETACSYYGVNKNSIEVVEGDVTKHNFGLSDIVYNDYVNKVSAVFHAAASVSHAGSIELIYDTNVKGTETVIEFCKNAKAQMYHMSSFAVSGFDTEKMLTEDVLNINQTITKNPYIETKYQAEEKVLRERNNGLCSTIFRIGNLTKRSSDGLFQINADTNGMSAQIAALNKLNVYPESMKNIVYDDTAVDKAAEAIVTLAFSEGTNRIWHIFNPKVKHVEDVSNAKMIPDHEFDAVLKDNISCSETNILSMYYHMMKDGFNIRFNPSYTVKQLAKKGFTW